MLFGLFLGFVLGFLVRHFAQPLLAKAKKVEAQVEKALNS
jgi:uncharacterized membrane-anchored protein YhcB (DUF1043 family)